MKKIPKKTGYLTSFDGTPIYYEVRGEGRPIFLAYGIACLINHWRHQIRYFSPHYKVIVWDYRGHHLSPIPQNREHLTIDALAQDIHLLAEHLQLESASFWGHSFGAQVLLRAYDMFPALFENMVFINGFANNPIKTWWGTETTKSAFQMTKQGYKILPETLSYLWKVSLTNPIAVQVSALVGGFNLNLTSLKDIQIYYRGLSSIDLDVFMTLFDQMITYDANSVLDRVNIPSLIISGSNDSITPKQFQVSLHQRIKKSQFLEVPYGSHCTQLDMPDFVNLRIEKFLKEHNFLPE